MLNVVFWLSAWLAASLPWCNNRLFGLFWHWSIAKPNKPLWLVLVESIVLYSAVFIMLFLIEAQRGERTSQAWQFWVITACMWIVLAFPAAAWFKLRKT